MSATTSQPQPVVAGDEPAVPPASPKDIDASCRFPVLLLFISAVAWLLIASVLGIVASLNFHMTDKFGDCAYGSYGRVHPANLGALIYGFAIQAGLGVALWIVAHLSRIKLARAPFAIAGTIFWNIGVTVGIVGIFYGDSTGYEWLEFPRYASVTLFFGFALIALTGIITLRERSERPLYISQWYILAALFWFPWVYSTAEILLVGKPVRGALQAGINWWFMNNLSFVWLGFMGIAAIFYFVPKIIKQPLQSHYTGIFIFWTITLFGSWGGVPPGAPLPSWMAAMSTMGAWLTLVPSLAVASVVRRTMHGQCSQLKENRALKFFIFGGLAFALAGIAHAAMGIMRVDKIVGFTWFVPAKWQLLIYGFFAMSMFGAIYSIVPRLVGLEFGKPGLICLQFILSGLGILVYVLPLMIGGIKQGLALNDSHVAFIQLMTDSLMWLRISTGGDLLMLLGHIVLALNLAALLVRAGRAAGMSTWTENTKTVGVTA